MNKSSAIKSLLNVALVAMAASLFACASQPTVKPQPAPAPAPQQAPTVQSTPAAPAPILLREPLPGQYVVKKGDTLWGISKYFLKDAWQWPELWYGNPQVKNPHLIYPGDVLSITWVDGKPRLVRNAQLSLERMSPQIRETLLDDAVPSIPLEAIRDFLRGPRIVSAEELARAPYVLSFLDDRLIGGEGDQAYVRGLTESENYTYTLVEVGEQYRDPDTGNMLGYEAIPTSDSEVLNYGANADAVSTIELTRSFREARASNRLLLKEPNAFTTDFLPHAAPAGINATIISVFDGVSQIGQYQIVALNRGTAHGLEPGHVLEIYQRGRAIKDPVRKNETVVLPDTFAGQMMVFKTEELLSYALIMDAVRAIHVYDKGLKPKPSR